MITVRDAGSGAQDNLTAVTDPGFGNDSTQGYSIKSWWLNTISMEFFVCLSATPGAANWQNVTLTIDQLGSMAVQNANNVAISGGKIAGAIIDGLAVNIVASGTPYALARGRSYDVTGSADQVMNLLAAGDSNLTLGTVISVRNSQASNTVAITAQGAHTINGAASLVLGAGDSAIIVYMGSGLWRTYAHSRAVIPVANGGTGATSAADARTSLGVPSTAEAQALAIKYAIALG